jgi:hypothetical protein
VASKRRGSFSDSVGGGKYIQGLLFNIDEPEAVVLTDPTKRLLFDDNTQWSLHLGTASAIDFMESLRRQKKGDMDIPPHDVKLHIAVPLTNIKADKEKALSIIKELVPDYDESKNNMVFERPDRLVDKQLVARGEETPYGKGEKKKQWVRGVSIETTDPKQVARFMAAAKQAPKNFKIAVNYNKDWFSGTPPKPNERLQGVLDASGIDHGTFLQFSFPEESSFTHETGLKDYLAAKSPAASFPTHS